MDLQRKIYSFLDEYWKLIKRYTPQPSNDDIEAWDKLLDEAGAMLNRYNDGSTEYSFLKELMFTWFDYIGKCNKG